MFRGILHRDSVEDNIDRAEKCHKMKAYPAEGLHAYVDCGPLRAHVYAEQDQDEVPCVRFYLTGGDDRDISYGKVYDYEPFVFLGSFTAGDDNDSIRAKLQEVVESLK